MIFHCGDRDYLVCKVEVIPHVCVTLYGRVRDSSSTWAVKMQDLIRRVRPETKAHFSDKERDKYHPQGSPKKTGYWYFHHVHIPGELCSELVEDIQEFLSPRLHDALMSFANSKEQITWQK